MHRWFDRRYVASNTQVRCSVGSSNEIHSCTSSAPATRAPYLGSSSAGLLLAPSRRSVAQPLIQRAGTIGRLDSSMSNAVSADQLRQSFLDFFAKREHAVVPSASLIPHDPTVMFTVAGMVPFKPYFVGDE